HGDNHATPQNDYPEALDPFVGIGSPEKNSVPCENPAPRQRSTPQKSVCIKLCIRRLFPTVAESLDDSDIAGKAGKISEKAQEIFAGHKRNCFSASDMARFYP